MGMLLSALFLPLLLLLTKLPESNTGTSSCYKKKGKDGIHGQNLSQNNSEKPNQVHLLALAA